MRRRGEKLKNAIAFLKSKFFSSFSTFSAGLSTIGSSWNVCHSACIALLSFLAAFGIAIAGFPLFFLFEYNLQLWGIAALMFFVSLALFLRKPKCIPKNLLVFNAGALIAGIPVTLVNLQPFSWVVGSIIALAAILNFLVLKLKKVV